VQEQALEKFPSIPRDVQIGGPKRMSMQDVQKGHHLTRPTPARQDVPFPVAAAASDGPKTYYSTLPP
jgi:hypothetical protein